MLISDIVAELLKMPQDAEGEFWCPDGYMDQIHGVAWNPKDKRVTFAGMMARHIKPKKVQDQDAA